MSDTRSPGERREAFLTHDVGEALHDLEGHGLLLLKPRQVRSLGLELGPLDALPGRQVEQELIEVDVEPAVGRADVRETVGAVHGFQLLVLAIVVAGAAGDRGPRQEGAALLRQQVFGARGLEPGDLGGMPSGQGGSQGVQQRETLGASEIRARCQRRGCRVLGGNGYRHDEPAHREKQPRSERAAVGRRAASRGSEAQSSRILVQPVRGPHQETGAGCGGRNAAGRVGPLRRPRPLAPRPKARPAGQLVTARAPESRQGVLVWALAQRLMQGVNPGSSARPSGR